MASVMGIWGGLVRPESGNVEKVLVFKAFLKGQGSKKYSRKPNDFPRMARFGSFRRFQKHNEKSGRKVKNGTGRR